MAKNGEIEDNGGYISLSFKKFARLFKKGIKNELKVLDGEIESYIVGHYYIDGFFSLPNNTLYYFSISDVRHLELGNMLYRTAEHLKDYTGGSNQHIKIEPGMILDMRLLATRWIN